MDLEVRQYTRQEAEAAVERFVTTGSSLRHMILEMYDRRAHKALGFTDFSLFARDRLGGEWDDSYLSKLRNWARIEQQVLVNLDKQRLTKKMADELARLPEEKRKQAYDEASTLMADNPLRDLKHIVNRMLGASDHYGKKAEKIVEQEVDIPVGAVVDVHTGKPIVEPDAFADPPEEVDEKQEAFLKELAEAHAEIYADQPAPTDELPPDVWDNGEEPEGGWIRTDLNCINDSAQKQLKQFRAFWSLPNDVDTVEKIIGQLYTTYSNKPNFAKLAE